MCSSPPPISEHNSASFHRRSGISTLKCAALCGARGGPQRANLEQFYNYYRGKMIQRNIDDVMSIGTGRYIFTGCPAKLFTLGYLLFCGLLLMQIAKVGTFLKNPGNLLHDRHKNFENRFRNSWDNCGQSWQPSLRNLYFAITQRQKNNFHAKGGNFDHNYLSYF